MDAWRLRGVVFVLLRLDCLAWLSVVCYAGGCFVSIKLTQHVPGRVSSSGRQLVLYCIALLRWAHHIHRSIEACQATESGERQAADEQQTSSGRRTTRPANDHTAHVHCICAQNNPRTFRLGSDTHQPTNHPPTQRKAEQATQPLLDPMVARHNHTTLTTRPEQHDSLSCIHMLPVKA